jgi:hypothetical protein
MHAPAKAHAVMQPAESAAPEPETLPGAGLLRIASNRFEDAPEVIFRLPRLAWLALAGNPMTQKQELDTLSGHGIEPILYQNLQIAGKLGEGASGHIYRASLNGQELALKVFKAAQTSDGTPQSNWQQALRQDSTLIC